MAGTSTMTGTVTANGAVAASMTGTSSMEGMVYAHGAVAAAMSGTSEMSAAAFAHGKVEAAMAGTSSMTGTVTATSGASLITANRTLHWDASDASNTVVSSEMTQIEDLSGTGNHATPQAGENGGDVQAAGKNGLDYVSFNGTDESLVKATPTGLPERDDNRTNYWVGHVPDLGNDVPCFVYGKNQTDLGWALVMDQNTPDKMILVIVNSGPYESTADSFDEWAVWCVQYDDTGGADTVRFFKNGVAVGTASPTDMFTSNAPDLAGIGVGLAGENVRVDVGEVVLYADLHDSSEIEQMTDYLGAKWGITIP